MFLFLNFLLFCGAHAKFDWDNPTALDYYVHSEDGYYSWTELAHYPLQDMDLYILNMTSQKWMDESFSSASVWYHEMGIAIPHQNDFPDAAMLAIMANDNDDFDGPSPPDRLDNEVLTWFVNQTNIVAGYIHQVPNQPVVFPGDSTGQGRREDDFIAWTWIEAQRVNGTVPEMVARMPMTKAAKRGLDCIRDFVLEKTGNQVMRYHVGGASKRGWTTWSLAAMDRRVISISPLVYSLLHFEEVLMHHFQSMEQGWSWALNPYWEVNLTCYLLDPLADILYDYEDPYRYRERLTHPKLVISATGDEFFLLTDSHYWWDTMPGQNWFMMNPNAEHVLFPHWFSIAENIVAFVRAVLNDFVIPTVSWTRTQEDGVGGTIRLNTSETPLFVKAFAAETLDNATRRDFRLVAGDGPQAVRWFQDNVTQIAENTYEHTESEVEEKYVGHFIQAEFEGPEGYNYRFTSEVNMLPDGFPGEPCTEADPLECCGELV